MAQLPEPNTSLKDLQLYIRQELTERGFADETIEQKFMLFLEEIGEFTKAARKYTKIKSASDTTTANLNEEAGDVLILFLDLCNKLGIDAVEAFLLKEGINKTRTWR